MRRARRTIRVVLAIVTNGAALVAPPSRLLNAQASQSPPSGDWIAYGHDALGSRFSPLAQVTRENVARLTVAWTYRTGETGAETRKPTAFEATPLMVDGTLYLSTPFGRVMALDPETGAERWTRSTSRRVRARGRFRSAIRRLSGRTWARN